VSSHLSPHIHPYDERHGASGIFILVELRGPMAERIHAIQNRFDPRLATFAPPHLTLVGSSGMGPIDADTPAERLREVLDPIVRTTPELVIKLESPTRFMQTDTVVLPINPHGPLRTLHERIKTSGLSYVRSRHAFTPHVTLSLYRTLTREQVRELLNVRITEPVAVDHLLVSLTREPRPPRPLFELELGKNNDTV
jgi:2'-5' RNA ligase